MLALTRKIGERIVIGDNIVIFVADIKGDSIRLAIEAPKEIKILRGEVYDSIAKENKQAASTGIDVQKLDLLKGIEK